MRWIVAWSLRFRGFVVVAALALLALGVVQLRDTSVEALPEFSVPYVEVQTEALGLSAYEVEQLITVPLEVNLLNGVAWLDEIRSNSVAGLSSIELIFEPDTDLLQARQMVQERLLHAGLLPNVSKPPTMLQPLSSASRVAIVGLASKNLSLIEMSVLARWNIKPRLMGVPGVANVAIWGQRERQLQVQVDPDRLRGHGVSLDQVISTTGNALWSSPLSFVKASTPGSGGFIDTPQQRLGIQHISPIRTAQDLAKVPVEPAADGDDDEDDAAKVVTLGDVGNVVEDHQPLIGDAVQAGGKGLMLVVEKFPGADTLAVTKGVQDALDALKPGLSGMEIDSSVYRPASFVESARANLALSLALGLLLLMLVVGVLLLSWRSAVVVLVTVPLALVTAMLVLSWRGGQFNTLALAGLVVALAVVVHDAVTDVDHIARRLRERGGRPVHEVVAEASLEVRSPLVYATLIAAAVAVPVLFLPDLAGVFLGSLVTAYLLAIAASLLVSLIVTPALTSFLLSRAGTPGREPAIPRRYASLLTRMAGKPGPLYTVAALVLVAGLAVGGFAVLPRVGDSVLPAFQDRDLLVRWETEPGTSHSAMVGVGDRVSQELRALPGVRGVTAHVGRAVASDQVVNINSGVLWVGLKADADYLATREAVRGVVGRHPGFDREVRTFHEESVGATRQTGAGSDVAVRVYGRDLEQLKAKAEEVRQAVASVGGVRAAQLRLQPVEPTVEVEVDLAKAQKEGLKPGDVRRAAAIWLSGVEVGSLFENQKVFEVIVVGTPATRKDLNSVSEIKLDTPAGRQVRLGDVATVRVTPNQNVFKHEATSRYFDVVAELSGRGHGEVAADIESKLEKIRFPLEFHAEVLAKGDVNEVGLPALAGPASAALLAALLLLQSALGGWRMALVALLCLPLALAGTAVVVLLGEDSLSVSALAGLLAVAALAIQATVLTAGRIRRLARQDGSPPTSDHVVRGAAESVVPVLTTSLAFAAAVLPLVLLGGVPGLEVARPVAIAMLGGLVSTLLYALFVLPALYLRLAPRSDHDTELRELTAVHTS
ncbi:efflux RND transporter permease subunit [Rhizohabitans arisaemae]|uniref:efflux RND transporter permease subunit n=1 Tax=Rhizohabitans arisaemae TaxID=2720610 RepID=UPI0024B08284|nr:efflux RND transporter permease subunit [Rhizohabitans arisaemae]